MISNELFFGSKLTMFLSSIVSNIYTAVTILNTDLPKIWNTILLEALKRSKQVVKWPAMLISHNKNSNDKVKSL